jgi:dephospho-CoA kinase
MAHQADEATRRALADMVITNDGSAEDLAAQVEQLWDRLLTLHETGSS